MSESMPWREQPAWIRFSSTATSEACPNSCLPMRKKATFWPTPEELLARFQGKVPKDNAALAAALLVEFSRALRRRRVTQEIMRWELLEQNELTDALARYREEEGLRWIAMVREPAGVDLQVLGSLLAAGLTYLTLRSKTAAIYNGLELRSEKDWKRIEASVESLVHLAFGSSGDRNKRGPSDALPSPSRSQHAAQKRAP